MPPPKDDFLRSVWRRPRPAPQDDDPADHGTAFGLDLSLDKDRPIASHGVAASTPAESTEPPPRWWSPLQARRAPR
jgi:hypothetical protein